MSDLLPPTSNLKIMQSPGVVRRDTLTRLDELIIVTPARIPAGLWKQIPDGTRLRKLARRSGKDKSLRSRLANPASTGLLLGRLPDRHGDPEPFILLRHAGKLVAEALKDSPGSLGVMILGLDEQIVESMARAFVLAAKAHSFHLPAYRSKPESGRTLGSLRLLGLPRRIDLQRTIAEADATNLARWLTAMPPNKLSTASYRKNLQRLAKTNGWKTRFLSETNLEKLGAGAFLAVAQGNADRDAGILQLRYQPAGSKGKASLALVGKGIIFDTGGNNLKPFKSMLDMHEDMAGSAVAVATLQALTQLEFPYAVDCWLAITENRISAEAYKSRDVVTASNGTTIEVIHTDAEGRMVLADTLALAGREKPGLMLDYATLTGACVYALTERYSGVFSNRPDLNPLLTEVGRDSGERVWPFPMDEDFAEDLKSKAADILQCSTGGDGDHIHAAHFLMRFVPNDTAWVHVDLSAASRKDGLAQVPPGATGFGVRFSLNLLLDKADELRRLIGKNAPTI